MAKRARGSVRPGQRRPIDRRPAAPGSPASPSGASASGATASGATASAAPRPGGLTEAEAARAAELEAQLLAGERAATSERRRTQQRTTFRDATPGGGLAVRAEAEYAYVARDMKRIIRIASLLFAILFVLWIVIDVAKIVPIG